MTKKYTVEELADILSQAAVLKARITASASEKGHKEHVLEDIDRQISNVEGLKIRRKEIADEIESLNKNISEDETQMNTKYKILEDNGIKVSDALKGTTIVNVG